MVGWNLGHGVALGPRRGVGCVGAGADCRQVLGGSSPTHWRHARDSLTLLARAEQGYIAQLPILSVVVDTMAHRRASWLVLGGVVSSASIALLGASLSKCNELCMALALCAGAEKRGEGDASPKAMQGVVEVPPRGHADVMR